jgi:hypothetical protein
LSSFISIGKEILKNDTTILFFADTGKKMNKFFLEKLVENPSKFCIFALIENAKNTPFWVVCKCCNDNIIDSIGFTPLLLPF